MKRKIILLTSLVLWLSGCQVTHPTYGQGKTYRLFYNPRVKCEYCASKQAIIDNVDIFYRKAFGKDKDYDQYKINVIYDEDDWVVVRYKRSLPPLEDEGSVQIRTRDNCEVIISKKDCKIIRSKYY